MSNTRFVHGLVEFIHDYGVEELIAEQEKNCATKRATKNTRKNTAKPQSKMR